MKRISLIQNSSSLFIFDKLLAKLIEPMWPARHTKINANCPHL